MTKGYKDIIKNIDDIFDYFKFHRNLQISYLCIPEQ